MNVSLNFNSYFHPFEIPPDKTKCINHLKATSTGYLDETCMVNQEFCPCCGLPTKKVKPKLLCSVNDLMFLGKGYPLYFIAYKTFFAILFVYTFVYFVPSIFLQMNQDDVSFFNILASANCFELSGMYEYSASLLFLIAFMIQQPIFFFGLVQMNKFINSTFINVPTPSDYTLLLQNIPIELTDMQLFKLFSDNIKEIDGPQYRIPKVIWVPDMKEYLTLEERVHQLMKHKLELLKNVANKERLLLKTYTFRLCQLDSRLQLSYDKQRDPVIRDLIAQLKKESEEIANNLQQLSRIRQAYAIEPRKNSCQMAFISYEEQEDSEEILNSFHHNGLSMKLTRAPDPSDFNWENAHITISYRRMHATIHNANTFGLGFISFLIQFFTLPTSIDYTTTYYTYYSYFLTGIVLFLGWLISEYVGSRVRIEKYMLRSEEAARLFTLLFLGSVFNGLIVPYLGLAYAYITSNDSALDYYLSTYQLSFLLTVLTSTVFAKFGDLIGRKEMVSYYYMWRINRGDRLLMTQLESHNYFEGPKINFPMKNAYLIKSTLIIMFYSFIVPGSAMIGLLGMLLGYWIDKYLLIFLGRMPLNVNETISKKALSMFLICQTVFIVLRFIVLMLLSSYDEYVSDCTYDLGIICKSTIYIEVAVLCLCIGSSIMWFFVIKNYFDIKIKMEEIFGPSLKAKTINYYEAKPYFFYDYEKLHPFKDGANTVMDNAFVGYRPAYLSQNNQSSGPPNYPQPVQPPNYPQPVQPPNYPQHIEPNESQKAPAASRENDEASAVPSPFERDFNMFQSMMMSRMPTHVANVQVNPSQIGKSHSHQGPKMEVQWLKIFYHKCQNCQNSKINLSSSLRATLKLEKIFQQLFFYKAICVNFGR